MHYYEHAVSKAEFIDTFRTTRQLLARETDRMVALLPIRRCKIKMKHSTTMS